MPLRTRLIILLVSIPMLMLFSCLDVEADIRLSGSGRVRTRLTYTMDAEIGDYGRGFGADEPWPFPLTEREFQQRSLLAQGTQVRRYRSKTDKDGREVVEVHLVSDSMDSLAAYLDLPIKVVEDGRSRRFVLSIPGGKEYQSSTEASRKIIDTMTKDSSVTFRFQSPKRPAEVSAGVSQGRASIFEVSLKEALYGEAPAEWIVSW